MKLKLKRVIIFTSKMGPLSDFYGKGLGLKARPDPDYDPKEWIEFETGGSRIALHKAYGNGSAGGAHKLVFYAANVAKARDELLRRKVKMGDVKKFGKLVMCDGVDPAGNRIQVSNRR